MWFPEMLFPFCIQADDDGWSHFDLTDLESKCLEAGFYRVLEKLFDKQEREDEILDCYLLDTSRRRLVFTWLTRARVSDNQLLEKMNDLVEIDVAKFANIVLKYSEMNNIILKVTDKLEENRPKLFEFLQNILALPSQLITKEMHDRYLQLMCEFNPDTVCEYLQNKENHEHYDIFVAYKLCEKFSLTKSKVYLLERQGRIAEAFKILKENLDSVINCEVNSVEKVNDEVTCVVEFCQRASTSISHEDKEKMWCSLLDACVKPMSKIQDPDVLFSWRQLVRNIVSSMLGHVTNSKVVSVIVSEPGYSSGAWGDVKQVIGDILETARYEVRLLERTIATIRAETAQLCEKRVQVKTRGVRCETNLNLSKAEEDQERVKRARNFLKKYTRSEDEKDDKFSASSILKSEKFPLKLKPENQAFKS